MCYMKHFINGMQLKKVVFLHNKVFLINMKSSLSDFIDSVIQGDCLDKLSLIPDKTINYTKGMA